MAWRENDGGKSTVALYSRRAGRSRPCPCPSNGEGVERPRPRGTRGAQFLVRSNWPLTSGDAAVRRVEAGNLFAPVTMLTPRLRTLPKLTGADPTRVVMLSCPRRVVVPPFRWLHQPNGCTTSGVGEIRRSSLVVPHAATGKPCVGSTHASAVPTRAAETSPRARPRPSRRLGRELSRANAILKAAASVVRGSERPVPSEAPLQWGAQPGPADEGPRCGGEPARGPPRAAVAAPVVDAMPIATSWGCWWWTWSRRPHCSTRCSSAKSR